MEGCSTRHHLWEGRQTRLLQQLWDLISLHTKINVQLHAALTLTEDFLPEAQCGFQANWWITDMILSLLQILVRCIEQNIHPYMILLNLIKAFDTANRSAMEYCWETRVPWWLSQACICLAYRNEGFNQLKTRILRTIWGWEWRETGLCFCPHTILDFSFDGLV